MPRKMPPLKKAEFLVVDVETTGLATDSDLILQIGAVVTNAKGTVLRSYSTYVQQCTSL
jgi:DNA polymerase III alpha subunit (gram-positive type)